MNENTKMTAVAGRGGRARGIALTALLLAVGVILRMVTPSVAGITPNWLIAMYCLAILLVKPSWREAAGIGIAAGIVSLATSKAIFPYASLVSEPIGATVCGLAAACTGNLRLGGLALRPLVSTLLSTLASGLAFIIVTKFAMQIPNQVFLYAMLPVVLTVAAVNCVVAQVLYYPAQSLFQPLTKSENVKESEEHV